MNDTTKSDRTALVIGATGIAGGQLCSELVASGWDVVGVGRRAASAPGTRHVAVDVIDEHATRAALEDIRPTHVFLTAWVRQPSEAENIRVNAGLVRNVLAAVCGEQAPRHVALVTGLKHYMGPFEAYGTGETRDTPFHEDEPRLDTANFYYAQEDELWAYAERYGFTWSVHRSHTIIGAALGNAMNMGQTLAVQAAVCRAQDRPFVFPGNDVQWNGITDMTDSGLLARHMIWAATTPGLPSQAYNVACGDLFRWRWMWPRIARMLNVRPEGFSGAPRPLEAQMADAAQTWTKIAAEHRLVEPDIDQVASWWHTDGDLNRPIECFTDMSRSRRFGFHEQLSTEESFARLFARLEATRVVPPAHS